MNMRIKKNLLSFCMLAVGLANTASGQLNLTLQSSDDFVVGQAAEVQIVLDGLGANELDALGTTISFDESILGSASFAAGEILPNPLGNPSDFLTAANQGVVDVSFLTLTNNDIFRISDNGVLATLAFTPVESGPTNLDFVFAAATQFNAAEPSQPIPLGVSVSDPLVIQVSSNDILGDFDGDGVLDADDIDLLTAAAQNGEPIDPYDLTGDQIVNAQDRSRWVNVVRFSYFGDSNLDGEFTTSDLVFVFQAGQYEDNVPLNSTWATGDWNGDGDFSSSDFVLAFQAGGFEIGPREAAAMVPEPTRVGWLVALFCCLLYSGQSRRRPCIGAKNK